MKRFLGLFFFLLLLVLSGFAAFSWYSRQLLPSSTTAVTQLFTVESGESAISVFQRLESANLIRSYPVARIYLLLHRDHPTLKPGIYSLSPSQPFSVILAQLTQGPKDLTITFPEGWRSEQYAARIHSILGQYNISFSTADFISQAASLEGTLFPDTYSIPLSSTPQSLIKLLTANFLLHNSFSLTDTLNISLGDKPIQLSGSQVVTLASLLERETNRDEDRPIVAGILLKRFTSDWPLQIDATVQYAADTQKCQNSPLTCSWWQPITDTKLPSAYNTYLNSGLPPAPISNPGSSSINAILKPKNTDYWYYITGTDGVTRYARTLYEHNSNIDKYLKP